PLELAASPHDLTPKERSDLVEHHIRLVGLEGFADHYPSQLSGGMKQRVGIARALASGADILLMDEPFASVDAQTRELMGFELLKICGEARKTIIFVTHSIDECVFLSDRVAIMTAGPTRVKEIVDIELPAVRDFDVRGSADFGRLRQRIWES